jgi:predicted ATPase/class 3 adenylate cyclase
MPIEPASAGRLSAPEELSGGLASEERRLITILFADLSGFTALSSEIDPEEVREAVNVCFSYLNTAIIARGGTVHKYEGDLVIALFGYPAAHEDDPERAVRAGFDMFDVLDSINRVLTLRLKVRTDLGLHVGINSGTVVVGEVGTPQKRELTVMGEAVNLASRLKDAAGRGEIVVSEPVYRASRYLFEYEALEPVAVKGIAQPVKVFRPLKERARPEPKRGVHGLTSPMVGREKELAELLETVATLARGKGGATWILGEAGLGKTRLLEEARGSLPEGVRILEGRCLTYGESVPYWPFLQILERAFGISDQDSKGSLQDKVLRHTKELCPGEWIEVAPYLGQLFSIRFPDSLDEKVKHLDAQALKAQIFLSLRKLLAALSRRSPLLLVIEDYQWMDSESLEFLEFLFDSPDPLPVMLLALSRPEKGKLSHKAKERLRMKLGEAFREIVLAPLDPSAGSRLVDNLLAAPGLPGDFKRRILAKAEGNPFYLEEIFRSLIDSGVLDQRAGTWELAQDGPALAIPDTVQAVISSRLDRLEADVREVLQMAAVIGRNFYVPVLERLSGHVRLMLTLYLADLEEHEYVSELARDPEWEYIFRHPMFQEVAYSGLLKRRRRELHRKAGEAIEELYQDRLEELAELLAHQYALGDDPGKAVHWLLRAGQKAKERYANDEAIACFEKVLTLVREELRDELKCRDRELREACEALGEVYSLKGDYEKAIAAYRVLGSLAEGALAGKDRVLAARARRREAEVFQNQSRFEETLAALKEAEQGLSGETAEELLEQAEIHISRSGVHKTLGNLEEAVREAEQGMAKAGAGSRGDPRRAAKARARALNHLGSVFWVKAEYDRAIEQYDQSLALAREINDKKEIGKAYSSLGVVHFEKGDRARAVECFQSFLALSEGIGYKQGVGRACGNLGNVHYISGDFDRALELYRKCLAINEELGDRRGIGMANSNLGLIYHDRGDYDLAEACFTKDLAITEEIGDKQGTGIASGNLGLVHYERGDYGRAIELDQRYLALSEELGDKQGIGIASCHLGNCYSALGDLDRAIGLYEVFRTLSEEIGFKQGAGRACRILGVRSMERNDFERAEEFLFKAEAILLEIDDRDELFEAYSDLAQLTNKESRVCPERLRSGRFPRMTLEYADLAQNLAEGMDTKGSRAKCQLTFGKLYASVGDFPKAEGHFLEARALYGELKKKKALADVCLDYARMLVTAEGKGARLEGRAEECLSEARALYEELNLPHKVRECV